jgi:hypothetical protein
VAPPNYPLPCRRRILHHGSAPPPNPPLGSEPHDGTVLFVLDVPARPTAPVLTPPWGTLCRHRVTLLPLPFHLLTAGSSPRTLSSLGLSPLHQWWSLRAAAGGRVAAPVLVPTLTEPRHGGMATMRRPVLRDTSFTFFSCSCMETGGDANCNFEPAPRETTSRGVSWRAGSRAYFALLQPSSAGRPCHRTVQLAPREAGLC